MRPGVIVEITFVELVVIPLKLGKPDLRPQAVRLASADRREVREPSLE